MEKLKMLIKGRSGKGKTKKVLFNETKKLITNDENLLFLDFKEEYYKTFGKILKEKGYDVFVLNLKNPKASNAWNPFNLIKYYYDLKELDFAYDLIRSMGVEIFRGDKNSDPFWENVATDYFCGLFNILLENARKNELNIGSIYTLSKTGNFITNDNNFLLNDYVKTLDITNPTTILLSPTLVAPKETRESILSVFNNELNKIISRPQLLNLLCTNQIEINTIKNKTAFFVIGDYKTKIITKIFLNIFIECMLKEEINFTYILDDFITLDYLESFNDLLLSNSKIFLATNSVEALEEIYDKNIVNMFTNELEVDQNLEYIPEGNYKEYPNLSISNHDYFDAKNLFQK